MIVLFVIAFRVCFDFFFFPCAVHIGNHFVFLDFSHVLPALPPGLVRISFCLVKGYSLYHPFCLAMEPFNISSCWDCNSLVLEVKIQPFETAKTANPLALSHSRGPILTFTSSFY